MKNLLIILSVLFFATGCSNSNSQTNKTSKDEKVKVKAYYFHRTRRCGGCLGAEEASVQALKDLYSNEMEKGIIKFQSINIEDDENKKIAKKYSITWSSFLLVNVAGEKEKVVNLTSESFAGKSNPEKLKEKIKLTIDKMIR